MFDRHHNSNNNDNAVGKNKEAKRSGKILTEGRWKGKLKNNYIFLNI